MKVLSLFSGVGGFDLGLERAGMQTVFQCEWDKHATKILERHWPNVPRWDDVSTLTGKHILAHAPVIDIVAWGSPCQDLSVAGKRAGLDGSRSGLFHEGIRIIKELQEETNGKYPRISLWENVYGALSSNKGADFGVILDEMAEAGSLVQEWRVLDAQYFGVPQRRRRVFLVSIFDSATAARCPNPLLPVSQSVRRDTETSGTERQEPAGTVEESIGSSSEVAGTLTWRMKNGYNGQDAFSNLLQVVDTNHARPVGSAVLGSEIVGALNAVDYKWPQNQQLDENKFIPVETFTEEALAFDGMLAFDTQFGSNANVFENHAPTLKASQAAPSIAYTLREREGKAGGGKRPLVSPEKSGTLAAGGNDQTVFQPHAVAYDNEIVGTLRSGGDGGVPSSRGEHLVVAPTLTATNDPSRSPQSTEITEQVASVYESTMAVRRLTPIECERLMGWPDNWTDGQADTHRYKQCGNGVASPVATWIGQHLQQLDKDTNAQSNNPSR